MKNEETGRISYYTSKKEVVYTSLMMCENAPSEWLHVPEENIKLFDLLADDYRTYLEIELTKGKREVTEDDEREADALCKRHLERWREELE